MHPRRSSPNPWGPDAGSAAALIAVVALAWIVLKTVSIWAWVKLPGEYGDSYYYFLAAEEAAKGGGVAGALGEYPTPAASLLLWLYTLGDGYEAYRAALIVLTCVADGLFALLLGRLTGPGGVLAWILLTTSLGQVALLRFDMLPAVVAGAALVCATRGATPVAAALIGLGTGLKLWPVLLLPLTLGRRGKRAWAALAFAVTGLVLVAGSLVAGGWARLFTPLSYQSERGLQIEAVPATLPMVQWSTNESFTVWFSTFRAFEVTGPTVDQWLSIADGAAVLAFLGCAALVAWWWFHGARPEAIGYLALTFVGAFVVTSRALSPQYLLWLAAPVAAVVALAARPAAPDADPRERGLTPALITLGAMLVLDVLTLAIYPVSYSSLTGRGEGTGSAVRLLVWRNLGLLAFLAWTATCSVARSRRP